MAAEHMVRRGFRILERNYRTRWGELDIVAFDGRTLAFCEVKSRRLDLAARPDDGRLLGDGERTPFEALDRRKRQQVRKMAHSWLHEPGARPFAAVIRFDAIGVVFDRAGRLIALEHLEDAF